MKLVFFRTHTQYFLILGKNCENPTRVCPLRFGFFDLKSQEVAFSLEAATDFLKPSFQKKWPLNDIEFAFRSVPGIV